MALLDIDSFDHLATADLSAKGWSANGANVTISSATGRNSTSSLRISTGTNAQGYVNKSTFTVSPSGATVGVGFAFKQGTAFSASVPLIAVMDGSNVQLILALTTSGTLQVIRGNSTTTNPSAGTSLGASAAVISSGVYYFIEFKAVIDNAAGTYEVKVDGVSVLSGTGADTQATANASWTGLRFGNDYAMGAFTATRDYDDFHVYDGTGGSSTTFLGDHRIMAVVASSGNGTHTDWAPSTGTDRGALVDETTPNTSDYVLGSSSGERVTFNFAALGVTGTVKAVQSVNYLKADVAGVRYAGPSIVSGGTTYDSSGVSVGSDWTYQRTLHLTDPDTSAAWTVSGIDAAEFGEKVTA